MSNKYNGWHNYETWNANLWLDQAHWFNMAKECAGRIGALAEQMKTYYQNALYETISTECVFVDLLQFVFDQINWFEIAEYTYSICEEE